MELRDLSDHALYCAGRGTEEVARSHNRPVEEFITLSSNENPLGLSPLAINSIKDSALAVHRSPTASHTYLTDKLASVWDVEPAQIWLANGGDGAIDYVHRAVLNPGDRVLVPSPGFSYYSMSSRFHHGDVAEYRISKSDDFALKPDVVLGAYENERIVYLTSPHNPTGGTFSIASIREIAELTGSDTLIVVDEAYGEFSTLDSAISLVQSRNDVAIIRTFSKAYGLAGCRLGYAVVPAEWADAYARVNTPFAASEIACRAGLAALDDQQHVRDSVELVEWARNYIRNELTVRTWDSQANFVLADVGDADTVAGRTEERGVIVRDCTSFGLPSCIRITCGTRAETKQAVSVINDCLCESQ
jgi:histidinol-phosphate aminotransferase